MFKIAGFHCGVFPIMLLQGCEEQVAFSICGSTIDVINVRGDEADQFRMESTMGASHWFCALIKLSPDLFIGDSLMVPNLSKIYTQSHPECSWSVLQSPHCFEE
eukprot:5761777-Prorocentrum_lima.AAC.1